MQAILTEGNLSLDYFFRFFLPIASLKSSVIFLFRVLVFRHHLPMVFLDLDCGAKWAKKQAVISVSSAVGASLFVWAWIITLLLNCSTNLVTPGALQSPDVSHRNGAKTKVSHAKSTGSLLLSSNQIHDYPKLSFRQPRKRHGLMIGLVVLGTLKLLVTLHLSQLGALLLGQST